ncbi:PREDICTED: probable G-protein coupled receptor 179 [Bison bison bison]|uniref:Probable G-protein coupled receptor 179 n=1 Tax=Bison bison bison TaxID=43346 RepID=A0A6P3HPZ1_BISBB|nr:PREDICTED: probable G-protein coupled receptor 179 [Bison bison bison]
MDTRAVAMPSPAAGLLGCCFLFGWALGVPRTLRSLPALSSKVKPGSVPIWVPPEGAEAALAFLYSGDAQHLSGANCSERYEAPRAGARPGLPPVLWRAAGAVTQAANFLNMLLQANDIRESSVEEDVEWYQALVRSVAEGDPRAYRALLTFNPPPGASHLQLALQATRVGEETILQDLSGNRVQEESSTGALHSADLQKRVLTNDLGSLGSPKWPQGDGYCQEGRLRPGWLITLSATFYGLKPDLSPEVRGQVQMDVDLQSVDINQCASGPGWYSNTHLCDLNSTQCVPLESRGFVLGHYLCRCRPGFYGASNSLGSEEGAAQPPGQFGSPQGSPGRLLRCQPCAEGCASCLDATPCLVEEAPRLRAAVLACQTCCMLVVFLSMLVSYRCRQSKRIRASGVVLLEAILFGSLLLYFPVFILYFKPSVFRCIALRWVRLLGFAIVYGTIILKLYRVLQLFLSRTAQRGPHLSSGRLLRRLGLLLLLVLGFLAVWTAGVLEPGIQRTSLVTRGHTHTGRHFYLCHHDRWDYIMVVAEMLLLCWGSFLCYATRAVPSAFHEPRYMGIALHNELLLSAAFHAARFVLVPSLHPDWTLLLFFFHTHSTVTATLALIFIPKFRKPGAPPREEILDEVYEDELDLQRSGSYLNSSITSAWSERSLDPGDIRDELKKLYAQLEVHKTKEMAANNPHLPKKRASWRQGLGRRLPHVPIRHQISTPIMATSGAGLGEPGMLSPTSTLAPALMPAPAPALAPIPVPPQSPNLLTYICPWENAELPVKKENVAQEGPSGPEQGNPSHAPARARLWRALSVAVEKRGPGENGMDTEDGRLQGETEEDENRPKVFSKSHSLKTPVQQGSMRSLGLAIKALTRSRSTHREKESGEGSPKKEEKGRASGEGVGACPRSPRPGRPKGVSKQAALGPCDDEESLQNQQNAHTSRMLQVCHRDSSREQEDRGRRTSQCLGEGKVERAGKTGPATLKQLRQGTAGDKNAKQAKEAPVGWQELPKAGLQPLGSADPRVTEVCPWEVTESELCQPDGSNKAEICPWEVGGIPEEEALRQYLDASQGEKEKASEKSEPKDVVVVAWKKPERLVRGQEAVCPWESADPGGVSPGSASQDSDRTRGRSEAVGSVEPREMETHRWEAPGPGACTSDITTAELCPWEASEGETGKPSQEGVKKLPQEKQKTPEKTIFWKEQKLGEGLESLCQWERTDFRGPSVVSTQAPGTPGCSGSLGSSITEVCPWEAGDTPAIGKAEICPWELGDEIVGKEMLSQGPGGESPQEKWDTSRTGSFGEMRGWTGKAVQKLSQQQESVCPWESTAAGHAGPHLDNSSSKADGQLLSNKGSRAAQVCPPDLRSEGKGATPAKAEVCPWEVNERTTEDWTSGQAPKGRESQKDKEKMLEISGIKASPSWAKPEEQMPTQEAVCPWESVDPVSFTPQPGLQDTGGPKASFQMSGSVESRTAEICPWDAEETLPAEKAEVCPWEVSAGAGERRALGMEAIRQFSSKTRKPSADSGPSERAVATPERQAQERERACPWESMDPGGSSWHSDTLGTAKPKPGVQELDRVGCRPVEVCPWEAEGAPTSEKVKVCPWEVDEGAPGKELEQEMRTDSVGQREKMLEKGRLISLGEDRSKWETQLSQEQEAVCPWEKDLRAPTAQAPEVSDVSSRGVEEPSLEISDEAAEKGGLTQDPKMDSSPEHVAPEKAEVTAEDGEKVSSELQPVHLQESTAPRDSSSHPHSQCPDQPKAGSQTLPRAGDRLAEVCLWDASTTDAPKRDSGAKAETCPWEVTERTPEEGASRQDGDEETQEEKGKAPEKPEHKAVALQEKPERADGKQEPAPQASDSSKESPKAAGSVGASIAEVCPREVQEAPPDKKTEICLWEVSQETAEKGGCEQEVDRESQGQREMFLQKAESGGTEEHSSEEVKVSGETEAICPWEGTRSEGLSPQPDAPAMDQPKDSPHGVSSMGSRVAELCQWEVTDPEGNKITGTMADIDTCLWEGTGAPSEESGLLALTATQKQMLCPTAPENPPCLLVQRPLGSFFPDSKSPRPKVNKPASTFTLEGVRELQVPSEPGPRTSLGPEPTLQEAMTQKSSSLTKDQEVASETQLEELTTPTVYPWDWE